MMKDDFTIVSSHYRTNVTLDSQSVAYLHYYERGPCDPPFREVDVLSVLLSCLRALAMVKMVRLHRGNVDLCVLRGR